MLLGNGVVFPLGHLVGHRAAILLRDVEEARVRRRLELDLDGRGLRHVCRPFLVVCRSRESRISPPALKESGGHIKGTRGKSSRVMHEWEASGAVGLPSHSYHRCRKLNGLVMGAGTAGHHLMVPSQSDSKTRLNSQR